MVALLAVTYAHNSESGRGARSPQKAQGTHPANTGVCLLLPWRAGSSRLITKGTSFFSVAVCYLFAAFPCEEGPGREWSSVSRTGVSGCDSERSGGLVSCLPALSGGRVLPAGTGLRLSPAVWPLGCSKPEM